MASPDFWNDKEAAETVIQEAGSEKNVIDPFLSVEEKIEDLGAMCELAEDDEEAEELLQEAPKQCALIEKELDKLELYSFFSGKTDRNSAIFSVNAGAGGTESCDWAEMLLRMYQYWFEKHEFDYEVLDLQSGDETGIKSATVMVRGDYVYGQLKHERGVHRLVRISPFDSNKRRHTSFAAVDVIAEIDDSIEVEVNEKDLRVDTFRSRGAGGQHVNTTDSAVRITHVPTGIVVACQNERSQHKNRATAMKIVKAKLYEIEQEKLDEQRGIHNNEKAENAWGNQIRSYVLHPYQMVKDLRTDVQTSNTAAVLDGDLDMFIDAMVRQKR